MATHRAKGGNRRRGKRKHPKQIKRQRRRRADANGCAKRAQRRVAASGSSSPGTSGDSSRHGHKPGTARRCAHCRRRRRWLRRSLCWQCYSDPILRGRYFTPEHTWLARTRDPEMRDALDLLAGVDVPAEKAAPCPGPLPGFGGSPDRQAELARRAAKKQQLFSPRDRPENAATVRSTLTILALFGITPDGGLVGAAADCGAQAG